MVALTHNSCKTIGSVVLDYSLTGWLKRVMWCGSVKYPAAIGIHPKELLYNPISTCDLFHQPAFRVVKIEMVETVALALPHEFIVLARQEIQAIQRFHVAVVLFFEKCFNEIAAAGIVL